MLEPQTTTSAFALSLLFSLGIIALRNDANKSCFICSREDQITLEAEYARNSKPDKAARLEIVKKVALGEKEVQVRTSFQPYFLVEAIS